MDQLVQGRRIELARCLKDLENRAQKENSWLFSLNSFRNESAAAQNIKEFYGKRRKNNLAKFEAAHRKRIEKLRIISSRFSVEDGGLKSETRVKDKLKKQKKRQSEAAREGKEKRPLSITDFSRIRIICPQLQDFESVYTQMMNEWGLGCVGRYNYYLDATPNADTPFRGLTTNWVHYELPPLDISTEVQIVTSRVRSLLDLNHAFDVARTAEYPNSGLRSWVHRLLYKASILDLQELLGE